MNRISLWSQEYKLCSCITLIDAILTQISVIFSKNIAGFIFGYFYYVLCPNDILVKCDTKTRGAQLFVICSVLTLYQ